MRKTRAFDLNGVFKDVADARTIDPALVTACRFRCLDENCTAAFHRVSGYRRQENTNEVPPHFARNPHETHRTDCPYDYETKAARHHDVTFMKNGELHLRINFPLGSSYRDLNPARARLPRVDRRTAEDNTGIQSARSLPDMVKILKDEFGGLESPALENLKLDYQGRSFAWMDIFVTPARYGRLVEAAASGTGEQDAVLADIVPEREIGRNSKNKRRMSCAAETALIGDRSLKIRPIIVAGDDNIIDTLSAGDHFLVAARPFVPATTPKNGNTIDVYLYLRNVNHATPLRRQMTMF